MSQVTSRRSPELIVALDVSTLEKAEKLVDCLYPTVKLFKIGSQLFTAYGPEAVKMVSKKGGQVFLDLKFYDIPHTVSRAVISGTSMALIMTSSSSETEASIKDLIEPAIFMMTVHTKGGKEMLEEAVKGARTRAEELKIKKPLIVGVTVLTSEPTEEQTLQNVLERAKLAKESGLDGVVCSAQEAAAVRKECGLEFIIVTPGIRPKGAEAGDQKRVATAKEAIKAGADFIVVGRPILEAPEPLKAAQEILKELS